jgi:hypothetical protein
VSSLLQKNPIANWCKYLWHQPGAQQRKRRTENDPAAGIDMLVGILVGFRNVQLTAFRVVKPALAAHQRDLIIRLMRRDKPFDMRRVIPVVRIEIGDRIKPRGVGENAADGARRITHVPICLRQDYVHRLRLFVEQRFRMPVGN